MSKEPTYEELAQKIRELERKESEWERKEAEFIENKERYERLINTIPCALYDYVRWPDGRSSFIYISPQCKKIFELTAEEIINDANLLWNMVVEEDRDRLKREDRAANQSRALFQSEVRIVPPSGITKWIQLTSMPSKEKFNSQDIWSGVILDVTNRKRAEEERNRLLLELQQALAEVKTLKGIIPICSYCKKIRDDAGYWNQVEAYISKHSEAEWSHGICPDCLKTHFPDMDINGNP